MKALNNLNYCFITYHFEKEMKSYKQYIIHDPKNSKFLTENVRIEKNRKFNSIHNADELLRIRDTSNWKKCTATGLRPINNKDLFYGDLPINLKKSLLIVKKESNQIIICLFPEYYPPYPTYIIEIIEIAKSVFK